ncbi:hypothetical protein B40_1002 [Lactococcus cremoris]|nr:hypothetical protein B40_1002 [Lactococcus cremoris]
MQELIVAILKEKACKEIIYEQYREFYKKNEQKISKDTKCSR